MKKKVLVMSLGSDAGGIEKSLIEFLKYLVECNLDVHLYLWKEPGILFNQIPKEVNILNSKLRPGSLHKISNLKKGLKIRFMIWYIVFRFFELIKQPVKSFEKLPEKYDIAISFSQDGYSPYYIIDKVSATKKYLWYHHGSYEKKGREKKSDLNYYKKYDRIITVSNANKAMLELQFPELKSNIMVINNILDEKKILELAESNNNILIDYNVCNITTVARLSNEKGQLLAIEIAKILKERQFEFNWIFVGDGPDRQTCEEKVREYGLMQNCKFVGTQANPYPFIKNADLYVQTSSVEADPITIQEAMILCKPIIASNIPAIQEALAKGKLGVMCNLDAMEFADAIIKLSQDKKIQEYYCSNIRNREKGNDISKKCIGGLLFNKESY